MEHDGRRRPRLAKSRNGEVFGQRRRGGGGDGSSPFRGGPGGLIGGMMGGLFR